MPKSDYGDTFNGSLYYSNVTDTGSLTIDSGNIWSELKYQEPTTAIAVDIPYSWKCISGSVTRIINPKGGDDMRYLYEVILVNPKNDTFYIKVIIVRSETSALMKTYNESQFSIENNVPFDDLKTSCRVLMEWKKEKSLKKAIETIKEAVE